MAGRVLKSKGSVKKIVEYFILKICRKFVNFNFFCSVVSRIDAENLLHQAIHEFFQTGKERKKEYVHSRSGWDSNLGPPK